jgi:cytochrome c oxidase subunit II
MKHVRRLAARLLIGITPLAASGCRGIQSVLDPAGDHAQGIAGLWNLMVWVCGLMYFLVLAFLAAAVWRRRRAADGASDELRLRRALGGWTVLIIVGLLTLILASFLLDARMAQAGRAEPLKIRITGAQWWWKVEYQDAVPARTIVTANELYLPVNRPVELELRADDVIHSLWIPNLAGKKDLIPGRINTLSFTATRAGEYRGQCAEFCGLQHAHMAMNVSVVDAAQFDRWREQQLAAAAEPATPQQQRGREVFMSNACVACHQIVGTPAYGQTGPNLTHLASRRTLAAGALGYSGPALRVWLSDPQRVKPGNHMPRVDLSEADLDALVAYLDALR